jgi:hypothetical protein
MKGFDLLVLQRKQRVSNTQAIEDFPVRRVQKIAAEFFPRKETLFEKRDGVAPVRQENRRGAAGRAGADDRYVKPFHGSP